MTLKSILVHMDATDRCKERLHLAGGLARANDSHLSGLFVIPEPFYPIDGDAAYFPPDVLEQWEREEKEYARAAESLFQDFVDSQGLHGEWRSEQGPPAEVVRRHARYADLTVVGQGSVDDPKRYPDPFLAEDVVMDSGRPVLVIPNTGSFDSAFKQALVCWNASREAVRAISDAMPFLQSADNVTILTVNPDKPSSGDHGEIPAADIALQLARHGVKAEAESMTTDQADVGTTILDRARDLKADLIIAGAYGHSRTREWILGGVTKTLLHETAVPTLLSH